MKIQGGTQALGLCLDPNSNLMLKTCITQKEPITYTKSMNNTNKTQVWAPSIYMQATFDVESNPTFPKNKNSLSSSLVLSSNISLISEIKGK